MRFPSASSRDASATRRNGFDTKSYTIYPKTNVMPTETSIASTSSPRSLFVTFSAVDNGVAIRSTSPLSRIVAT